MTAARTKRLLLSLALSAACLWWAFKAVDLSEAFTLLSRIEYGYVAFYALSMLGVQACRTMRWDVLTRPFAPLDLRAQLRVSLGGFALIMALPLRLGELARPYLLKRESGAPLSSGLAASMVERGIDGLLVTLLFFGTTMLLPERFEVSTMLFSAAWLALAVFGSAMAGAVAALVAKRQVYWLIGRLEPLSPKVAHWARATVDAFLVGLGALPNARSMAAVITLTLAYWALSGLGLYSVMVAFGWNLPVVAGYIMMCVIVLGIMIPAGPGFLGPFQAAIIAGLSIFGVDPTAAAAYGLVIYPINVLIVVGGGLPFLFGRTNAIATALDST